MGQIPRSTERISSNNNQFINFYIAEIWIHSEAFTDLFLANLIIFLVDIEENKGGVI